MKKIYETIIVAFSMYSSIPVPNIKWNKSNMEYALCALPVVGVVIGSLIFLWSYFSSVLNLPVFIKAMGICLLPALLSGGIHLDGYADVYDALSSYASKEKRQEILKDPHCGAFAIIHLCIYFIAYYSLCSSYNYDCELSICIAITFVLSRSAAGIAMTCFPLAKNTGLAYTFSSASNKKIVKLILSIIFIIAIAFVFTLNIFTGFAFIAVFSVNLVIYYMTAKKKFGGINGDLSGWFLIKSEFWAMASIVLIQILEANK